MLSATYLHSTRHSSALLQHTQLAIAMITAELGSTSFMHAQQISADISDIAANYHLLMHLARLLS